LEKNETVVRHVGICSHEPEIAASKGKIKKR